MQQSHWVDIILNYVFPSMGVIMASVMFAAPIHDLRKALQRGRLGALNPLPWAVMTGNCLGWAAYGYYTRDPFVLAANIPGFILSFWLNGGAAKLQYLELWDEIRATTTPGGGTGKGNEEIVMVSQEKLMLRMLVGWSAVLVYVGWIQRAYSPAIIVGLCVNVNLVFFYGAPLEAMRRVIRSQSSDAIHTPTMLMNLINTTFWMAYGLARRDPVISVPNGIGFILGIIQGTLVCIYPKRHAGVSLGSGSNEGLVDEFSWNEENLVV